METVVDLDQLDMALKELVIRVEESRNLLDNGRILRCDRKLQGALVKCNTMLRYINDLRALEKNVGLVADKSNQEAKPDQSEHAAE